MKLKIVLTSAITLLLSVPTWAVEVKGRVWLQPADYTGLSWNDVDAQCPLPDRLCTGGPIPGIAGYYWATGQEIEALYASFGAPPPPASESNSAWATAIHNAFSPTLLNAFGDAIVTIISDELPADLADRNYLVDGNLISDFHVYSDEIETKSFASAETGHHFYQPLPAPKAVPALSSYGLLLTSLGLIIVALRRLYTKQAKEE